MDYAPCAVLPLKRGTRGGERFGRIPGFKPIPLSILFHHGQPVFSVQPLVLDRFAPKVAGVNATEAIPC
jgi:hypothetical protein